MGYKYFNCDFITYVMNMYWVLIRHPEHKMNRFFTVRNCQCNASTTGMICSTCYKYHNSFSYNRDRSELAKYFIKAMKMFKYAEYREIELYPGKIIHVSSRSVKLDGAPNEITSIFIEVIDKSNNEKPKLLAWWNKDDLNNFL